MTTQMSQRPTVVGQNGRGLTPRSPTVGPEDRDLHAGTVVDTRPSEAHARAGRTPGRGARVRNGAECASPRHPDAPGVGGGVPPDSARFQSRDRQREVGDGGGKGRVSRQL